MKLWCYNDAHDWGAELARVATARGHDVHVFENPRQPDEGIVFMHMQFHPQVRMLHKRCMEIMSMNPNLVLLPDIAAATLYDDKIRQAVQFAKWMPRTRVFYNPRSARQYLDLNPTLPFVSKSSEGASSHNVRLVSTYYDAKLEIKHAFSDIGIKGRNQQWQRGYLLWQDFVAGSSFDLRVIAVGGQRILLQRGNRKDSPTLPSTGTLRPVVQLDTDLLPALALADAFFEEEGTRWGGADLIRDAEGKWYLIETTVSWTLHGFYECMFLKDGQSTGKKGDRIWEVLVDEIEAGAFA